jgi:hypothetical protein
LSPSLAPSPLLLSLAPPPAAPVAIALPAAPATAVAVAAVVAAAAAAACLPCTHPLFCLWYLTTSTYKTKLVFNTVHRYSPFCLGLKEPEKDSKLVTAWICGDGEREEAMRGSHSHIWLCHGVTRTPLL